MTFAGARTPRSLPPPADELTDDARIGNSSRKGTKIRASEDDPRYVVKSEKSGKIAAHNPDSLEKR